VSASATAEQGFGHEPAIPSLVVTGVPRLDPVWFERFGRYSACDVADVVGPLYVCDPRIVPLYRPVARVTGQALTVKAWPGDNLAVHGALDLATDGDVLVVDWRGHTASCGAGAQVLAEPARRGMRGVVIDGAWRDGEDLQAAGLPVFARCRSPFSPAKHRPGEINVPVACGGVVVHPGDLVLADGEGVAVVPVAHLERVWERLSATADPLPAGSPASVESARDRGRYYRARLAAAGGEVRPWEPARDTTPTDMKERST
jgi:4-hydroxy-4-methyl-2-oxoglutarate aldolase